MVRLISAIVTLIIAAVFLGVGITFKFFSDSAPISEPINVAGFTETYLVIDRDVMVQHAGKQVVIATGTGPNTAAFGANNDVTSWLGGSAYVRVGINDQTGDLTYTHVSAEESTKDAPIAAATADSQKITSPAGSDMWLGDASTPDGSAQLVMKIGQDESVIVASDGKAPLPASVTVQWQRPKPVFLWMTDDILMLVGGGFLLLGIILYLWALRYLRGTRGPRRRGRLPRPPRPSMRDVRKATPRISRGKARGRRATARTSFIALGLVGALTVGLTGCAEILPGGTVVTPAPTETTKPAGDGPRVVVTERQMQLILSEVVDTLTNADAANDEQLIQTRFTGVALAQRLARYAMRKSNAEITALPGLTATPVQLLLPQATELWPRSVLAIVKATQAIKEGEDPPSMVVVLTQQSPRTNYKVSYLASLQANQVLPEVAAPQTGSQLIAQDTELLKISPKDLPAAYADVIYSGDASKYAVLFDKESDKLRPVLVEERAQQQGNNEVTVTYEDTAGVLSSPIAFGTVDSGALVAVEVDENAQFIPLGDRDLKLTGQLAALSGIQITQYPTRATYGLQLLFYVPAADSPDKIQLLGYNEHLVRIATR